MGQENRMVRRLTLVLVCFGLVLGDVACTLKRVGPTAGAGYVFSVQVSDAIVWLGPVPAAVAAARFPQVAEVLVEVEDAQGRPVEDVPVTFALEPGWARSASLAPSETRTQGGKARSRFFEPRTSGVVRILVQVDGTPAQVTLTVRSYQEPSYEK
jgi:hypothetical protein